MLYPPQNSKIKVKEPKIGTTVLSWENESIPIKTRMAFILFLLVCLISWSVIFFSTLQKLLSGNADFFLYFWITGWSIGGIFIFLLFILFLLPQAPEKIILKVNQFSYYPGSRSKARNSSIKSVKRRKGLKMRRRLLNIRMGESHITLKKDPTEIILDHPKLTTTIGDNLSDSDKNWLYTQLKPWFS